MGPNEGVREPEVFTIDTPVTAENFRDLLNQAGIELGEEMARVIWSTIVCTDDRAGHTPLSIANVLVGNGFEAAGEMITACIK